jgi:hypothetical protein
VSTRWVDEPRLSQPAGTLCCSRLGFGKPPPCTYDSEDVIGDVNAFMAEDCDTPVRPAAQRTSP